MWNIKKFNASNCPGVFNWNVCIPYASCNFFMNIPREYQCEFVRTVPDCTQKNAYIQFMEVFACEYNCYTGQIYTGVGTVLAEIIVLFLLLTTTANFFFGPSLCAVSNILGLTEHFAGVTILAFGNAAPDIVTSIIGASRLGPELVLCQLLGGGIFVTSVVAGCILVTKQFRADVESFMRDTLFYLIAVSLLFYSAENDIIELWESLALIVFYFVYVGLVIWQMVRSKRADRKPVPEPRYSADVRNGSLIRMSRGSRLRLVKTHDGTLREVASSLRLRNPFAKRPSAPGSPADRSRPASLQAPLATVPRRRGSTRGSYLSGLLSAQRVNELSSAGLRDRVHDERVGHADSTAVLLDGETVYEKHASLLRDFVNEMNPVDEDDWEASNGYERLVMLLQAPVVYVFKFVIPVVDQSALNNGWCKLLNAIHCVTAPLFSAYAFQITELPKYVYLPVMGVLLAMGSCAALIVLFTSSVDRPPRYHMVYALVGFLVSIQMIYCIAHELVYVIGVLGYILVMDLPTLAMTLLAWGNSVGDLVANVALSRAGHPQMAWAGCFGSPLMSVLLGAGISFTAMVEQRGVDHQLAFQPQYKGLIFDCFFFLFLSLSSSLIIQPTQSFQCRRSYGCYLLVLYLMYIVFTGMVVRGVIHPLRSI